MIELSLIVSLGTEYGEWAMIGQIVLKGLGIGSGGVALFNVLKTYLQRKPTLEIVIKHKGGASTTVKAGDLSKKERLILLSKLVSDEGQQLDAHKEVLPARERTRNVLPQKSSINTGV